MGLPPYCALGDASNVGSCISHANYMCSREEPVCTTQNAVQNFIQQTPFLSGNTSEILIYIYIYISPDSLLKQAVFIAVIVSHLPE